MDNQENRFYREPSRLVPGECEQKLHQALHDLQHAVDSRGLRILLFRGSSYTSWAFRDALRELTSAPFSADRVVFLDEGGDGSGERTFARHLQLLTNCYVAALELEQSWRHG